MGDRQGPAVLRDQHFVEPPFLQTFTKLPNATVASARKPGEGKQTSRSLKCQRSHTCFVRH